MTIGEMRQELKYVRDYYAGEAKFATIARLIDIDYLKCLATKYNQAIVGAEPKLVLLYHALYVEGMQQTSVAREWNYTPEYIRTLARKLDIYLLSKINQCHKEMSEIG